MTYLIAYTKVFSQVLNVIYTIYAKCTLRGNFLMTDAKNLRVALPYPLRRRNFPAPGILPGRLVKFLIARWNFFINLNKQILESNLIFFSSFRFPPPTHLRRTSVTTLIILLAAPVTRNGILTLCRWKLAPRQGFDKSRLI